MRKKYVSLLRNSIILLTLSLAAACSSVTLGPAFQKEGRISAGQALVYLYRPSLPYEFGVAYDVEANGVRVTTLADGSYFPYQANPGRVVFSSKTALEPLSSVVLTLKPGETHYIKCIPVRGIFVMKPQLAVMDQKAALEEIGKTRLAMSK